MSLVTEEVKSKADIYHGHEKCEEKAKLLLKENGLPNGLLPLHEIEECGYVRETGFVWLKRKKSITHKFDKIGKVSSYAPVVTAVVEPNRMKKITGIKTKEFFLWISLSEVRVDDVDDDPPNAKITFKTPTGLSRSFPLTTFEVEEDDQDVKDKVQM